MQREPWLLSLTCWRVLAVLQIHEVFSANGRSRSDLRIHSGKWLRIVESSTVVCWQKSIAQGKCSCSLLVRRPLLKWCRGQHLPAVGESGTTRAEGRMQRSCKPNCSLVQSSNNTFGRSEKLFPCYVGQCQFHRGGGIYPSRTFFPVTPTLKPCQILTAKSLRCRNAVSLDGGWQLLSYPLQSWVFILRRRMTNSSQVAWEDHLK